MQKVGLLLYTRKTRVMAFNTPESIVLKSADGQTLQVEKDLKYLGSWINSSEKDIKVRKALAWNALHSIHVIWKSKINLPLKRRLFIATVESVLTYVSESWTLTVQQQKSLDGTYTRMLHKALNIFWQENYTNKNVYGKLITSCFIQNKIQKDENGWSLYTASGTINTPLILWEPAQGKANRGHRRLNYVDVLKKDTGLL